MFENPAQRRRQHHDEVGRQSHAERAVDPLGNAVLRQDLPPYIRSFLNAEHFEMDTEGKTTANRRVDMLNLISDPDDALAGAFQKVVQPGLVFRLPAKMPVRVKKPFGLVHQNECAFVFGCHMQRSRKRSPAIAIIVTFPAGHCPGLNSAGLSQTVREGAFPRSRRAIQ